MGLMKSRAGVSGTGATRAMTSSAALTGSAGSDELVTTITVENTTGSTKTNQFLYFPLLALDVASGNTLAIYDDNGSGGKGSLLANFQPRRASDRAGLGRHFLNGLILPSIAGSAVRILHIDSTSDAAPTGTAITASDVLALGGMANGGIVFECVIGGTTYSATLKDMLTAGPGTFGKTTDRAEVWTSGPTFTYFACNGPIRNGGTAYNSGDGPHVFMRGMVWKAGTGADTILGMDFDVYVEQGAADRGSPAEVTFSSWTVKRATSLSDATLISTNDTDAEGITHDYTSGGSETTPYGARSTIKRVFIGDKPACIWAYGTNASANVTDDTQWDYILSTKVIPRFDIDYADVDHSSAVTALNASGLGNLYPTDKGEFTYYGEGATGGRQELAPLMYSSQKAMCKWNADGRYRLFGSAQVQQSYPIASLRRYAGSPSTGALGCWSRWDSSTQYNFTGGFNGTTMSFPVGETNPWGLDIAHGSERCIAAYLMTGRLPYLEMMCAGAWYDHAVLAGQYLGDCDDKTLYGPLSSGGTLGSDSCFAPQTTIQERGQAWGLRDIGLLALLTPDDVTGDKIVWPKASTEDWLANNMTRAAAVAAANTGNGAERWATDGPRWTQVATFENACIAPWQSGYHMQVLHWLAEAGMNDAAMDDFTDWYSVGFMMTANADVAYQYYFGEYWCPVKADDTTTNLKTWADCYKQHARKSGSGNPPLRKVASGNFTLGATSGNDVSLESPYATTWRASWHEGGRVVQASGGTGEGLIDLVTDGNTARMDISAAFSGTTIAAANLYVPYPHPLDAEASRVFIQTELLYYFDLNTGVRAMMKDRGYTGASSEYATVVAWRPMTAREVSIRPRT